MKPVFTQLEENMSAVLSSSQSPGTSIGGSLASETVYPNAETYFKDRIKMFMVTTIIVSPRP